MTNRKYPRSVSDHDLAILVNEIHSKLEGVIFNGGFETLSQNVQNMDRSLREAINKIEELHKVVYEPDDGLFARVKKVENSQREEMKPLQENVNSITTWKGELLQPTGLLTRAENAIKEVEALNAWKGRIIALMLSMLSATVLMIVKLVFDFFKDHISVR